ncbi:MAG: hypothetical protein HZB98_11395, partial [Bacteroidia bacterium]|nr:hypothetical protein [Bacteroidia bacterium]
MNQNSNHTINKRSFALVLSHHRLWGPILLPWIIELESNKNYYRLTECLSPFPGSDTLSTLGPEDREAINILNEYSDRNLFNLFSREKSVKDFLAKITPEKTETFIRPYIERRIYKCLSLSRDEGIPVYYQKSKTSSLHREDQLTIHPDYAMPLFSFNRET